MHIEALRVSHVVGVAELDGAQYLPEIFPDNVVVKPVR